MSRKENSRVRRVIVVDGWQLMWCKHGEDKDGAPLREWKAAVVTDEMIERGATAVAELLGHGPFAVLDHAMDRQIAEDVLRAALEVPDA